MSYMCPYCGNNVATGEGYAGGSTAWIYICPMCMHPTYFAEGHVRIPGERPGEHVDNVPDDVDRAYEVAREALGANAPTASALVSRKVLMHIAVDKGAKPGQKFAAYVDYLADAGYVPPDGRGWVDHIRDKGNEAAHDLPQTTEAEAKELIEFTEMLLRFVYDLPARAPKP